jgi:hypothetical protein
MRKSLAFSVPFFASAVIPAVLITLAACSSTDRSGEAPAAHTSSAIINGQLDTTHQAVVAVILQQGTEGGLCSGTIVKVDPVSHIGWVLAAAHCVNIPPVYVLQGNDFSASGTLSYDVLDYKADARYSGQPGSPYDFAVLRIIGVDASTPTIPMVSASDGLAVGTSVLSVGYGRTSLIATGTPAMDNTIRRHVAKQLSSLANNLVAYDMATDGICQGDSGGPVLVSSGGVEKVAAVHSFVQGDCNGTGVSVRVSFDLSFINGELAKAPPTEDCALCGKIANSGNGTCAALTRSCLADKDCNGYYQCLSAQPRNVCLLMFPKAQGPFNAAANCQCTEACTAQCKSDPSCAGVPKCGYKYPAGSCATCTESSCCTESLACAVDGTCYVCLDTKDKAAECATNAARQALSACQASKCTAECATSTGADGGSTPAGTDPGANPGGAAAASAAAPGTTTTTSGCSVARVTTHNGSRESGAGYALVGLAAALVAARRRRR